MLFHKICAVLCGCLWLLSTPLRAEPIELSRQILLKGGKPAAGAKIDIWVFDGSTTTVKEHKTLRLPPDGWLRAQVELPPRPAETIIDNQMGRHAIYDRHYFVVDAPNAPVAVVPFNAGILGLDEWKQPLRLEKGGVVEGDALVGGKAQPGVQVAAMWLNGILLNSLDGKVENSALRTTSAPDGTFKLRPLLLDFVGHPHDQGATMMTLLGRATVDGVPLVGTTQTQPVPPNIPPDPRYLAHLHLNRTWTASGKVVNEVSGQPVAGARVEIDALSAWPLEAATTDARGEWKIGNIPFSLKMVAVATHPKMSVGHAVVSGVTEETRQTGLVPNLEIRVRPLALVTGKVQEEGTGKMPSLMFPGRDLPNDIAVRYEWGEELGGNRVGGGLARAPLAADGSFSISVPVGEHDFGVRAPGYEAKPRPTLEVPASGLTNVTFTIVKKPAFYMRFVRPDDAKQELSVAIITDREYAGEILRDDIWYKPAKAWGDTIKIKVARDGEKGKGFGPVLETELTADPQTWPKVITLPAK